MINFIYFLCSFIIFEIISCFIICSMYVQILSCSIKFSFWSFYRIFYKYHMISYLLLLLKFLWILYIYTNYFFLFKFKIFYFWKFQTFYFIDCIKITILILWLSLGWNYRWIISNYTFIFLIFLYKTFKIFLKIYS